MLECTNSFSCTLLIISDTSSLTTTFLKLPKGPSLSTAKKLAVTTKSNYKRWFKQPFNN